MQYNKTKRGLEKAAAILGIIVSAMDIIAFFILFILGLIYSTSMDYLTYMYASTFIATGIIGIAAAIPTLIISIMLVKSPIDENGNLKNRNGIRIGLLVLSILSGSLVVAGLLIAVLCLKDFVGKPQTQSTQNNQIKTVEEKLAQIKNLKELGVIDDETYKKAVQKVFNDVLKN